MDMGLINLIMDVKFEIVQGFGHENCYQDSVNCYKNLLYFCHYDNKYDNK